jgi:NAD(P)-dependent dehydrogenase (short-subunit alcohol dehydrogenase family)
VEEYEQVAAARRKLGLLARAWKLDEVQPPSIRGFVEGALAEFGRIDVLVEGGFTAI